MKAIRRLFIVVVALAAVGISASAQGLQDTIRIPLEKLDIPGKYCISNWMSGKMELIRDSSDPDRVVRVNTRLRKDLPLSIDFSDEKKVTYSFGNGYSEITVPVDSMQIYRKRKRGEAEGVAPEWNIGNYSKGDIDFSIWVMPDVNVMLTADSIKFLNDFLVNALITNVYKGEIDTPEGPFSLKVYHTIDKDMYPSPTILPEGKYEDYSDYVPEVAYGIERVQERGRGSLVRLGEHDYYLLDSITPDFKEVILSRYDKQPAKVKTSDKALAELKPYLEEATAQGKLLLVDFWGTWCRPCIAAMPQLKELEEKYGDRLMVLSVIDDMPDNFERGKEILDKQGLSGKRLFREKEPLVRDLKVDAFPTYILLDKDGSIIIKGSSAKALGWVENYLTNQK